VVEPHGPDNVIKLGRVPGKGNLVSNVIGEHVRADMRGRPGNVSVHQASNARKANRFQAKRERSQK
jgi:hypothetical protein